MCGVTEAVKNQMENLQELGHKVYLITPDYPNYCENNQNIIRILSHCPDKKRHYYSAKFPILTPTITKILSLEPDILHSHGPYVTHYLANIIAKKRNIPVVMTWHTLIEDYIKCWAKEKKLPSPVGSFIAGMIVKSWIVPLCNKTDLILAPTSYIKNLLTSYGITAKIKLLPLAIDVQIPDYDSEDLQRLRTNLSISPRDKILLYVGRITPEKNINELLNTFQMVLQNFANCHLVLVGGGEIEKFISLANNFFKIPSDKITFVGEVKRNDVFKYYSMADIFLYASITDNSPRTILEAMACGLPIVAVDAGGVGDLVVDNITGYLVENNRIADNLKTKVIEALTRIEKTVEMSKKAKKEIFSDKYNTKSYALKLTKIYHDLIWERNMIKNSTVF